MIRAERVAAAATQMIATGMKIARAVITRRKGSATRPGVSPSSPPSTRKNTAQPISQTADRTRAITSLVPGTRR